MTTVVDRLDEARRKWSRNEHTHADCCPVHGRVVCGCLNRCRPCEADR